MNNNSNKKDGIEAEAIARDYLKQHGLGLLSQNFFSRFGEIDLIMKDKEAIVFVEVRKRSGGFDAALESITLAKQRKLVRTAQYYLLKLGYDACCRFDAVVIDNENNCQWLKNIIIL